MNPPLLSTISLFTELLITVSVFYIVYKGYKHNKFLTKLTIATLLYELIFNISYMASRTPKTTGGTMTPAVMLAIFHGVLSLVMFISLIIFFIVAWNRYRKEHNFFKNHKVLTIVFLFFWTVSVLSGVVFYVMKYILHV